MRTQWRLVWFLCTVVLGISAYNGALLRRQGTAAPAPIVQATLPPLKLNPQYVVSSKNGSQVTLEVDIIDPDFESYGPQHYLIAALKQYPKAKKFVLDWSYGAGGSSVTGQVIYHRKQKTLAYDDISWWGNGEGSLFRVSYSQVTEDKLKAAAKFFQSIQENESLFANLQQLGCVVKKKIHKPLGKSP